MNICVCIKQVPDTTEIKIDPVKHTLIRDGVPSIVNPFDCYALEHAARIRDKYPDTKIVVVTMGPEQAKKALRECMAIAADKAYLITDRKFGGSDTLATSYILSESIQYIEKLEGKFDAIFCGKQAIDGDTAQVGPEIAEHLGYPQVTFALKAQVEEGGLRVTHEGTDIKRVIETKLPCVVTFAQPDFRVRYPNVRRRLAANRREIPNVTSENLDSIDLGRCGLKGSPTRVKSTFVPVHEKKTVMIKEDTLQAGVGKLAEFLREAGLIG